MIKRPLAVSVRYSSNQIGVVGLYAYISSAAPFFQIFFKHIIFVPK